VASKVVISTHPQTAVSSYTRAEFFLALSA
jgi:hypothetical protein